MNFYFISLRILFQEFELFSYCLQVERFMSAFIRIRRISLVFRHDSVDRPSVVKRTRTAQLFFAVTVQSCYSEKELSC